MLGSISPVGEAGRNQRWRLTATAHTAASADPGGGCARDGAHDHTGRAVRDVPAPGEPRRLRRRGRRRPPNGSSTTPAVRSACTSCWATPTTRTDSCAAPSRSWPPSRSSHPHERSRQALPATRSAQRDPRAPRTRPTTAVARTADAPSTASFAERLFGWLSRRLGSRTSTRRSFRFRAAVVGSALAVDPAGYALRPGTAYGSVCGAANTCSGG